MADHANEESMRERAGAGSQGRAPARTWALWGALWGLASVLPIAFPQTYFRLLGYPLARTLRWVLPAWYAVLALAPVSSVTRAVPAWAFAGAICLLSMAFGGAIALAVRRVISKFVSEPRANVTT